MAKILEKVVAAQLNDYLNLHILLEPFQSGFWTLYSTETALLKVTSDLLMMITILVLLDLSAAFDTVIYDTFLCQLSGIGISGAALAWFKSYLSDCQYYVFIREHKSATASLTQSNPHGSVIGLVLFNIYKYMSVGSDLLIIVLCFINLAGF